MENNNFSKKFTNTSLLMGFSIGAIVLGLINFSLKQSGADVIVFQVFGGSFWFIVIGFVIFTLLSAFQPGVSFAVKYDPNIKNNVVFDQL